MLIQEYYANLNSANPVIYDSDDSLPNHLPRNERIAIRKLAPSAIRPNGEYLILMWRGERSTSVYLDIAYHMGERLAMLQDLRNPVNPNIPGLKAMNALMADALEFALGYLED